MRPRILFLIDKITYGGAAKVMVFLANKLALEGYEVSLLAYERNNRLDCLEPEVRQVDFEPPVTSAHGFGRLYQLIRVRRAICRVRPHAILSFKTFPNLLAILAAAGTRTTVIISERGDPFVFQSWFTRFRDLVYHFADGYVFQTNGARNYYQGSIRARAAVIPNPSFLAEIPPKWYGNREQIIVHVGRFELKQKRQDILISAFSEIAGRYPNLKLVLYGDGEDSAEIQRIIRRCKLGDRVVLAGVTRHIHASIQKARLFVLSSDYEGIPNALIEAMSVGLPCVSTDCSPGGAAELIRNMENGILVGAGRTNELARAMAFMLDNPQVAERMGENASRSVSVLDPAVIVGQWKDYIGHCLSARSNHT